MSRFPDKETDLVQFLRQHRPSPPTSADLETTLLEQIRTLPQVSRRRWQPWVWIVSGVCVLSALAIANEKQRWQMATQFTVNEAEIEAFMLENWQEIVEDPTLSSPTIHPVAEWMTLTETEPRFSETRP